MFDTVETLCHKKKAVSMNVDKNRLKFVVISKIQGMMMKKTNKMNFRFNGLLLSSPTTFCVCGAKDYLCSMGRVTWWVKALQLELEGSCSNPSTHMTAVRYKAPGDPLSEILKNCD